MVPSNMFCRADSRYNSAFTPKRGFEDPGISVMLILPPIKLIMLRKVGDHIRDIYMYNSGIV